nr:aldehyde dehydrogenase (NADP(+)) [Acinetobacter sichuanensis]
MQINGAMLIGAGSVIGNDQPIYAKNPRTNETLEPVVMGGTFEHVDQAARLASQAFDTFRNTAPEQRAQFLEACADEIMALGDTLLDRASKETGLPIARLTGERGRTVNQLKLFASVLRAGNYLDVRIDPALPNRTPMPRSDLRFQMIALGPVAVFGASNFPLAFSVAGGDTASALAAGCPVIVKAHSAHLGTSELVGQAIQNAVKKCNLPEGVFSLIFGSGANVGVELVKHPLIKAVGFTGSRNGGLALMDIANKRPEPIPVYAEMSSINPVFILPHALSTRAEQIGKDFAASLTGSAGQLCTNPGLVIVQESESLDLLLNSIAGAMSQVAAQTMLTEGIYQAYANGIDKLEAHALVEKVSEGLNSQEPNACQAKLFKTTAEQFLSDHTLSDEVFGSSSLVVVCKNQQDFSRVAEYLEGQLTATLLMN